MSTRAPIQPHTSRVLSEMQPSPNQSGVAVPPRAPPRCGVGSTEASRTQPLGQQRRSWKNLAQGVKRRGSNGEARDRKVARASSRNLLKGAQTSLVKLLGVASAGSFAANPPEKTFITRSTQIQKGSRARARPVTEKWFGQAPQIYRRQPKRAW